MNVASDKVVATFAQHRKTVDVLGCTLLDNGVIFTLQTRQTLGNTRGSVAQILANAWGVNRVRFISIEPGVMLLVVRRVIE